MAIYRLADARRHARGSHGAVVLVGDFSTRDPLLADAGARVGRTQERWPVPGVCRRETARQLRRHGFSGTVIARTMFADEVGQIIEAGADRACFTMAEAGVGLARQVRQALGGGARQPTRERGGEPARPLCASCDVLPGPANFGMIGESKPRPLTDAMARGRAPEGRRARRCRPEHRVMPT